ncbi:hypothetical protein PSTT_01122, partial [Puccinia striiformis]
KTNHPKISKDVQLNQNKNSDELIRQRRSHHYVCRPYHRRWKPDRYPNGILRPESVFSGRCITYDRDRQSGSRCRSSRRWIHGSQLFGPGSANNDIKSITVGEVIAVLGDHSDDVKGTINVPLEWNSSNTSPKIDQVSSSDPIDHSQANPHGQVIKTILPLSPAVNRLLHDLGVKDATKIKGTGLRGRLTKGDILTHFKKVTSPLGTASKMIQADADARLAERSQLGSFSSSTTKSPQVQELEPLLPEAVRLFITEGLSDLTNRQSSPSSPTTTTSTPSPTFDSILNDYIPLHSSASNHPTTPHKSVLSHTFKSGSDLDRYFHGFL